MSAISIVLVIIVAFLAGMEGVLDEFQFHQPLVACTLIGLVTGQLEAGIILGGTLQMIALGWANIGAAVAPDAALASVASAIILVLGGQGTAGVSTAIAVAIPLAVAGLFLTMVVRTLSDCYAGTPYCNSGRSASVHSCDNRAEFPYIYAGMADRWYGNRRWNGCSRWLCDGYQHDGNKRSLAVLCNRFLCCCTFRSDIDRIGSYRCISGIDLPYTV